MLGQVVTSGVRILVFAVVTGIGTQIFGQILPSDPAAELSLQDALTVLLASMTVGGLALYAPKIASGIVSGAPQLGLGAAAAPAGIVAGTVVLGGIGAAAAARGAGGAVASAATLAGGARTAYAFGSATAGGEGMAGVAGGIGGVADGRRRRRHRWCRPWGRLCRRIGCALRRRKHRRWARRPFCGR